jgi:3-hydroxy acid dehydrogenase / malonic semialdehyde reductase
MKIRSLKNLRVLVTGATSGIGRATALAFMAEGAVVYGVGRRQEQLNTLEKEATEAGFKFIGVQADFTESDAAEYITAKVGQIDILVNVAGIAKQTPILEGDPADWQRIFDTNVLATLRLTQAIAKPMVARGEGHIINITSALARAVYPYTTVYAASKHALAAITRGLRLELCKKGIKVTEVAPGLVGDTEFLDATTHPDVVASYKARPYLPITAVSVADAVVFAASVPGNAEIELIELKPVGQP